MLPSCAGFDKYILMCVYYYSIFLNLLLWKVFNIPQSGENSINEPHCTYWGYHGDQIKENLTEGPGGT